MGRAAAPAHLHCQLQRHLKPQQLLQTGLAVALAGLVAARALRHCLIQQHLQRLISTVAAN